MPSFFSTAPETLFFLNSLLSPSSLSQFFASRKQKNLLQQTKKSYKESRSSAVGSPSSKSTLDWSLSKSPKGTALTCVCEPDDSLPRHEIVKRNLASEIGSGSNAPHNAFNSEQEMVVLKKLGPALGNHLDSSAQCPSIVAVTEIEKDSSEAAPSHETPSEGNLELKKSAIDFLSLH